MSNIDPKKLYSFAEACSLIPSSHHGKTGVHVQTLYNWRNDGKLTATKLGGHWFIWGAELLKLLPEPPADVEKIRSPAQRRKAIREAEEEARRLGLIRD